MFAHRLTPAQQKDFETEILGLPENSGAGYIDMKLLTAVGEKERKPVGTEYDTVYVGVDPLSHGVSEMGLSAIAYSEHGELVILAAAAVGSRRPQLVEIRTIIGEFLRRLRAHVGCGLATLVPIVEW